MNNPPKYRNGRAIKVGDIAIGAWKQPTNNPGVAVKMCATVAVIETTERAIAPVTYCYVNGQPEGLRSSVGTCDGRDLLLFDDVFEGDV